MEPCATISELRDLANGFVGHQPEIDELEGKTLSKKTVIAGGKTNINKPYTIAFQRLCKHLGLPSKERAKELELSSSDAPKLVHIGGGSHDVEIADFVKIVKAAPSDIDLNSEEVAV